MNCFYPLFPLVKRSYPRRNTPFRYLSYQLFWIHNQVHIRHYWYAKTNLSSFIADPKQYWYLPFDTDSPCADTKVSETFSPTPYGCDGRKLVPLWGGYIYITPSCCDLPFLSINCVNNNISPTHLRIYRKIIGLCWWVGTIHGSRPWCHVVHQDFDSAVIRFYGQIYSGEIVTGFLHKFRQ